jgi:rubrerythrin
MENRFYKELWALRFDKMLKLEEQSVTAYRDLLAEIRQKSKDHVIGPHLERLIADEKRHVGLVRELQEILARQKS